MSLVGDEGGELWLDSQYSLEFKLSGFILTYQNSPTKSALYVNYSKIKTDTCLLRL